MTAMSVRRHLARAALEEYLTRVAPAIIVVPGEPPCHILFDLPRHEMTLRTLRNEQDLPSLASYEHVSARITVVDGKMWSEFTVRYGANGYEAYLLLCDIADMIQQNQLPFPAAAISALSTFQDLLARAGTLSPEKQTGLYGELLFLESCLTSMAAEPAIEAWKGYAPNEHDFVLPGGCFEIKTTQTEKRRHKIGSLEQLDPLPGVPLWLVSVQITSAGPVNGRSLAELVDDVRKAVGPARPSFDSMLARTGWRDRDRALYREYMTLRSTPAAYRVDGDFPVLSRKIVQQSCARPELVVDAVYTIDLTSLRRGDPPTPADRFVQGEN